MNTVLVNHDDSDLLAKRPKLRDHELVLESLRQQPDVVTDHPEKGFGCVRYKVEIQ